MGAGRRKLGDTQDPKRGYSTDLLPTGRISNFLLKMISGVCQEEKNKYILIQICGIKKSGIDDLICKAEVERQMRRMNNTHMDTKVGVVVSGMNWETGSDMYIHIYTIDIMNQIDN